MTEVEPPVMPIPFGAHEQQQSAGAAGDAAAATSAALGVSDKSLEATLFRDETRNAMRRTSSAGDIPRTWKGNIGAAAMDLLSIRRGSATSIGTVGTGTSSVTSKDTDVSDIVSQLGPWRSLIPSAQFPTPTTPPELTAAATVTAAVGARGGKVGPSLSNYTAHSALPNGPHFRMHPRQYPAISPPASSSDPPSPPAPAPVPVTKIPGLSAAVSAGAAPPPPLALPLPASLAQTTAAGTPFAQAFSSSQGSFGSDSGDATTTSPMAATGPPSTKSSPDQIPKPVKKPLRSVLRRPSSPNSSYGGGLGGIGGIGGGGGGGPADTLGALRSEPALNTIPSSSLSSLSRGGGGDEAAQHLAHLHEHRRSSIGCISGSFAASRNLIPESEEDSSGSGSNAGSPSPPFYDINHRYHPATRKTSAPDVLRIKRSTSSERPQRPKSATAGPRKTSDGDIDFEHRVSFSADTGRDGDSSDENIPTSQNNVSSGSNYSEGQRKAFSAFMGQTRKHSGGNGQHRGGEADMLTAEEARGMRIFLEQSQKRRSGPKGSGAGNGTGTGSDDEVPKTTTSLGSNASMRPTSGGGSSGTGTGTKRIGSEPERSEVLESYSSLARKHAKASGATYTTTKQTHISNMSIFKSRPDEPEPSNDFSVTIVAEHPMVPRRTSGREEDDDSTNPLPSYIEGSSDDIEELPTHPARKSSGSIRTRKLYLNTGEDPAAAMNGSAATVSAGSTWRPGRIRASIASTSGESRRSSDAPIRSPWMKAVRLPPRWLSLRNAMAVTNVIIITLAIVIITIVSYVSGRDTAATALDTLGNIALKSIALSIGNALARAEDRNGDTATAVTVYGLRPDSLQCPAFFWSTARHDSMWSGDQFYMVDAKGAFCGLLATEFPGFESFDEHGAYTTVPAGGDSEFVLRVANGTAPAPRYTYNLNNSIATTCPDLGLMSCVGQLLGENADNTDIYDATQRPYYKQAVADSGASWTSSYNLGSGDGYGFTNVLPIHASTTASPLIALAAVDIHLGSLSDFLSQSLSALLRALDVTHADLLLATQDTSTDSIQFLIADLQTDSIIASTCPGLTGTVPQARGQPQSPDSPPRPYSSLTADPCFGNLAAAVGSLANLPTDAALNDGPVKILSAPLRVWTDSALTVASRFNPREGLQWAIVGRVPGVYFHIKLGEIYTLTIPLTAALVLVASALGSFLITRAIGRPLKRAAEKMMRIADLNFDEDLADTEAETDGDCSGGEDSSGEDLHLGGRRWSFASLKTRWKSSSFSGALGTGNSDDGRNQSSDTAVRRSFFLPPRSVSNVRTTRRRSSTASSRKRKQPPFVLKEIQLLNTAMDAMTSGLKSFSKYVPLDVVALLVKMKREAVLGVDEMSLSIFFSDIANFTTIAESMSPQQLVLVMSEYLSEMSSIILESQGIVDKFIGDAVMAFWNAPLYLDEHAIVACDAALKSQERLRQMRADWLEKGYPEIRARIGLNTGPALVGNLGSPTRLNYTCLGDTVNLASRLEELNKRYHTSIIVSDAVRDQVHEYFVLRPLDYVAVKGKTVAKKCFELVDSVEECDPAVSRRMLLYEKAFDYYCQGEFEQAKLLFESYLVDVPWDVPATMHLEECMRLEEEGVPGNWSPVVVLDEK
ncbi:hypothetical protein HDU88_005387 [Geranomyces variabilis]|nr:hypothetical protein HDU88_005387 [Geranomyces variabilis]